MQLTYENITLRDYVLSDVEDEVRWTNVETEWFRSDLCQYSFSAIQM